MIAVRAGKGGGKDGGKGGFGKGGGWPGKGGGGKGYYGKGCGKGGFGGKGKGKFDIPLATPSPDLAELSKAMELAYSYENQGPQWPQEQYGWRWPLQALSVQKAIAPTPVANK